MKQTLFRLLLFVAGNAIAFMLWIVAFQSPYPFSVFVIGFVHLCAIIFFPYQKLIKTK